MARPSCFRLLVQEARRAASRADWTAGRSRAIKTAMIAITTSNSIRVKPRDRLRREGKRIMEQTPEGNEPRTVAGTPELIRAGRETPCRYRMHPQWVSDPAAGLTLALTRLGFEVIKPGWPRRTNPTMETTRLASTLR